MTRSTSWVVFIGLLLTLVFSVTACKKSMPKIEYKKMKKVPSEVMAVGFGFGSKAEEDAQEMATKYAHAMANPKSMIFEYFTLGEDTMLRLKVEDVDAVVDKTEGLPKSLDYQPDPNIPEEKGVTVYARARRDIDTLQQLRHVRYLSFQIESELPTLERRIKDLSHRAIESGIRAELMALGIVKEEDEPAPEKVFGFISLFSMDWNFDKADETLLDVVLSVRIEGQAKMSDQERSVILMNGWRNLRDLPEMKEIAETQFRKAVKLLPYGTDYLTEYGSYWLEKGNKKKAIKAFEQAHEREPARVEFCKWLRQLYLDIGNKKKAKYMEEVMASELNVDEEDITSNMKYNEIRKWVDNSQAGSEAEMIQFRQMDEDEQEEAIKRAKVREE